MKRKANIASSNEYLGFDSYRDPFGVQSQTVMSDYRDTDGGGGGGNTVIHTQTNVLDDLEFVPQIYVYRDDSIDTTPYLDEFIANPIEEKPQPPKEEDVPNEEPKVPSTEPEPVVPEIESRKSKKWLWIILVIIGLILLFKLFRSNSN